MGVQFPPDLHTFIMKKLLAILLLISTTCLAQVPGVQARSYIVTDLEGNVLISHDAQSIRPIASITKLLVAEQLTSELRPTDSVIIQRSDIGATHSRLRVRTKLTQQQLLELALICSSNQAIVALARSHDTPKIIAAVNAVAKARGLTTISIDEPSGLSNNNRASAEDLAKFVSLLNDPLIEKITTQTLTSYGKFHSTNPYLGKPEWNFLISKTGYTSVAGGCVLTKLTLNGKTLIVVILGSRNTRTRWADLMKIKTFLMDTETLKIAAK